MGKFNKGVLFGGLLGAGLMWLNTTKKGRTLRDEIVSHAADVYERVRLEVHNSKQFKHLSEHEYVQAVQKVVETYAIEHALSSKVKAVVAQLVAKEWPRFKRDTQKDA